MVKIEDLTNKKEEYTTFFEWLFDDDRILDKSVTLSSEIDLSLCSTYEDANIYYPNQIKTFFDTKAMQRLGRISQLGLASNAISNLYHTRLEHSKGVYNRKIEEFFYNFQNPNWKKHIEENNLKLYLIAELIKVAGHDIGHFPFSHAFEEQVIGKRGFHEELGKRLMLEDKEITKVVNSISSSLHTILEDLYSKDIMNFKSHDESSYDNDRLDYLQRDNFYAGYDCTLPSQKYKTIRVKSDVNNCPLLNEDSSIIESSDGNLIIDVYGYESLSEILKALNLRQKQYKDIYMNPKTSISESSINNFLQAFVQSSSNIGKDLREYLLHLQNNKSDSQNIDLEYFKQWNEVSVYSSLLEVAQKHENKNIRDLATMIIPKFSEFLNILSSFFDLENKSNQLSSEDINFLSRIKTLIKTDGELLYKLQDSNFINSNILLIPENADLNNTALDNMSNTFSFKTASYKKEEPVYIQNTDGKIYELSSLPGLEEDILKKDKIYLKFLNIPFLRFNGVSEDAIDKLKSIYSSTCKSVSNTPKYNMSPVQTHHNIKDKFADLEIA